MDTCLFDSIQLNLIELDNNNIINQRSFGYVGETRTQIEASRRGSLKLPEDYKAILVSYCPGILPDGNSSCSTRRANQAVLQLSLTHTAHIFFHNSMPLRSNLLIFNSLSPLFTFLPLGTGLQQYITHHTTQHKIL